MAQPDDPPAAARVLGPDWAVSWASRHVLMPGGAVSLTQFDITFEGQDEAVLTPVKVASRRKAQHRRG